MDILLNNAVWLIVLVATGIGFIAFSAFTVRKRGANVYFRQLGRASALVFVFVRNFIVKAVGLLAQSAKTKKFGIESDIAPSGGVLNYRTGNLDDGTDPIGWYERN